MPRAHILRAAPAIYHSARLRPNYALPRLSIFVVAGLFHSLALSAHGAHASCGTALSAPFPLPSYASTLFSTIPPALRPTHHVFKQLLL